MGDISHDDLKKVFNVLTLYYQPIPLEIFVGNPYKILIATLMSARTNDDVTVIAAKRLFGKAPDIFALNKLTPKEIEKLIYPVGFYKTKAKYISKLSDQIVEKFEGEIPSTREELINLPGVGRKTANLVLNRAFGYPAIAVDIHVHRITNLLGWVNTKSPLETENELMKIIPEEQWAIINKLFVSLGRQIRSKTKLNDFLLKNKLVKIR